MTNLQKLKELKRIAKENGGILKPETVVESAKPKSSPLHECFCWDDAKAAHEYRLWQARQMIRVVVDVIPNTTTEQEVFVSLSSDRKGGDGYRVLANVLSDKELREQLLKDALTELEAIQKKYASLKELARVFAEVDRVRMRPAKKVMENRTDKYMYGSV